MTLGAYINLLEIEKDKYGPNVLIAERIERVWPIDKKTGKDLNVYLSVDQIVNCISKYYNEINCLAITNYIKGPIMVETKETKI